MRARFKNLSFGQDLGCPLALFSFFFDLFFEGGLSFHLFQASLILGGVIDVLKEEGLEDGLLVEKCLKHFLILFEVPLDCICNWIARHNFEKQQA